MAEEAQNIQDIESIDVEITDEKNRESSSTRT